MAPRKEECHCWIHSYAKDKYAKVILICQTAVRVFPHTKYSIKKLIQYVKVILYLHLNCETAVLTAIGKTVAFNENVGLHQKSALSISYSRCCHIGSILNEPAWTRMFADDSTQVQHIEGKIDGRKIPFATKIYGDN